MNVEEDIKKLENTVQDNIDILSEKIVNYNKKLKEFNLDGKLEYRRIKKINLNFKFILPCFILLYIIIYFILLKSQPNFVYDKIKNDKTYFIEDKLCNFKLISFTFIFTLCSLLILYFLYYIYNLSRD